MFYTDDPGRDADRYWGAKEDELDKLPRCCECDEPIQSDECYEFNDELICPKCLDSNHRKWVDNYVNY